MARVRKRSPEQAPSWADLLLNAGIAGEMGGSPLSTSGWHANGEAPIRSLRQINALPPWAREAVYRRVIPSQILRDHGIDPFLLQNKQGERLVSFRCEAGTGSVVVKVKRELQEQDSVFYLEMTDTAHGQIEVLLLVVNDLTGPRFHVDVEGSLPTKFGALRRNVDEEAKALQAGLAPGQIRRGLRIARMLLPLMEDFAASLGHRRWLLEPLAYHNAILFEQHGFGYIQGREFMKWIHGEFQPGGELYRRLDGSTPFRRPEHAFTVRGRSWAIHDGILGRPWSGVRMFREVGRDAAEATFPGAVY
ncbi:MAG: hypothetical protein GX605_14545 [Chloroflexi bacterium]|nr:hypothetical protein [Chloroflexota bacterium]